MTKLMEQVKEIQRKAHVCTECKGQKTVIMACSDGWTLEEADCAWCDGTGQVEAPEIDALVKVIEVLASAVDDPCLRCDKLDAFQTWCATCDKPSRYALAKDLLDN